MLYFQASGKKFQHLRQLQEVPNLAYTRSLVEWYQGSAYLGLTGTSSYVVPPCEALE